MVYLIIWKDEENSLTAYISTKTNNYKNSENLEESQDIIEKLSNKEYINKELQLKLLHTQKKVKRESQIRFSESIANRRTKERESGERTRHLYMLAKAKLV